MNRDQFSDRETCAQSQDGAIVRIAILGATGFVGQRIAQAGRERGHKIVPVSSPRLQVTARDESAILNDIVEQFRPQRDELAASFRETDIVINAAGLASPASALTDELVGANAALPALAAIAARQAKCAKFLHVSSAAVYGDARTLDETQQPQPISPYGHTKFLGEQLARRACTMPYEDLPECRPIIYRATSVHGAGRRVTEQIRRIARSPLATVAAPGDAPTPQTTVDSVADFVLDLATLAVTPDEPVLHPWEGWTTSSFLEHMGGRRPRHLPPVFTRLVVALANAAGRAHPALHANARRLDMLWHGQKTRHKPAGRGIQSETGNQADD